MSADASNPHRKDAKYMYRNLSAKDLKAVLTRFSELVIPAGVDRLEQETKVML